MRSSWSGASGWAARWRSCCRAAARTRSRACLDDGLVEDPEAHAAGELADRRMAQLRGHDEPVERLVELVAQRLGQRLGILEAPVEERHHGGHL